MMGYPLEETPTVTHMPGICSQRLRHMNAEIAWAAGLWEGEGYARVRSDKKHSTPWPHVVLRMCDEEPVREFARIMDFGNLRRVSQKPKHWCELWCWDSASKREVPRMACLLPWLSPRKARQLQDALDVCVLTRAG